MSLYQKKLKSYVHSLAFSSISYGLNFGLYMFVLFRFYGNQVTLLTSLFLRFHHLLVIEILVELEQLS
ncbi:hypothetical protein STFR1_30029 [Bacillus vallismortis]